MALSTNPALGGDSSSSPGARGNLTANPAQSGGSKKKKGGGLLGVGKSLLGEVTEFLGAPQQALFKGVRGVGQIATGDVRGGAGSLASAAKSAATFAVPGAGLAIRNEQITPTEALQPFGVNKLPRGVDTTLSVVADPLNVATFGVGSLAKQGLKVAGRELGEEAVQRIATQGLRKGLSEAEKQGLRSALARAAEEAGARNAERTAAKQFKAVSARGRGGLGVRVPFTGIGAPIVPGTAVARIGEATGLSAAKGAVKGSRPVQALARGFIPGRAVAHEVGTAASEQVRAAGQARRSGEAAAVSDLFARTKAAVSDYERRTGRAMDDVDDAFVHNALESGDEAIAAAKLERPELARVIDTFDQMRRVMGQEQVAAKVLDPDALHDEATYLHRIHTPEASKMYRRAEQDVVRAGGSTRSALNQGAAKGRKIGPSFTARQINEAIAAEQAAPTVAKRAASDTAGRVAAAKAAEDAAKAAEDAAAKAAEAAAAAKATPVKSVAERLAEQADAAAKTAEEAKAARLAREAEEAQRQADDVARQAAGRAERRRDAGLPDLGEDIAETQARVVELQRHLNEQMGQNIWTRRDLDIALRGQRYHALTEVAESTWRELSEARRALAELRAEAAQPLRPKMPEMPRVEIKTSDAAAIRARRDDLHKEITKFRSEVGLPPLSKRVAGDIDEALEKLRRSDATAESFREKAAKLESLRQAEEALDFLPTEASEGVLRVPHHTPTPAGKADRTPSLRDLTREELERTGREAMAPEREAAEAAAKAKALSEVRREAAKRTSLTREANKAAKAAAEARAAADEAVAKISDVNWRSTADITADEQLAAQVRDIAQKLKPGEKLYKESAVTSLLDRGVEAAKAVATASYVAELRGIVDDTGEKILLSADDVAAGTAVPKGWDTFTLPKLGVFHAPPVIKNEIAGVVGRLDDPTGLRKAADSFDRWWRGQVTAALPGGIPFAARNARTNVMLMWLSGTNVPKYMGEAAKLQRDVRRVLTQHAAEVADNGVEATLKQHLDPRHFKLWDYARKSGITGDAFYAVDLGDAPRVGLKVEKGGRLARAGRAVKGELTHAQTGRKVNQAVEQHARLSQFLADVDRLGDLEAAAQRTKDVLFDYSALTPTERQIKRWVMPFYTFARKNVPAQVRSFIEAPGRYVLPEKLAAATTDPLPEGSPEWQERGGSRLSKVPGFRGLVTTPERPLHAAVETLAPLYDLASGRGQEGLRGVASNVGGIPAGLGKAVVEQALGKSLFTGYDLPKSAVERQKMFAQTILPQLGRRPLSTYLPTATEAQRKKREQPSLAQLLRLAGVPLEPVNEKEMKRQARLRRAAAAAERGN